jgi:hypothetical protein
MHISQPDEFLQAQALKNQRFAADEHHNGARRNAAVACASVAAGTPKDGAKANARGQNWEEVLR